MRIARRVVEIADPGSTHFDARLDRDEVIEIHDIPKRRPPTMPAPIHRLGLLPKYSDALIETDVWVKSWMLLDIDNHGAVARAKFLNRPGHDLDRSRWITHFASSSRLHSTTADTRSAR